MKALTTIVLLCFTSLLLHAQKFSIADVTVDDLKNLTFEKDSGASAVILHDVGRMNRTNIEFWRQLRVKILKKSGLEWGNWVFNTPDRGDFRVTVYNLENGQLVKEKASPKTIFTEEVIKGYYVSKVFAPNVKVGSIIDISYTHFGPPREWWFQNRVPVVYSELMLEPNSVFSFSTTQYGFEKIETINSFTWRARNMPAFQIEPFLNDYKNYITKLSIQLTGFSAVSLGVGYSQDLGTSWKVINNSLLDNSRIQEALNGGGYLKDFVRETKDKNLGSRELIQVAYDHIQANLKWDGTKTILPSPILRNCFLETHNGNSADINLTLVALLKELGLNAYPVALSTRDNGLIVTFSPNINKLNYPIAYVKHGDINMALDATQPGVMPGILPAYCLNGPGIALIRDAEEWVDLTPTQASIKRQLATITLDKTGAAKATISNAYSGYGYLSWSSHMKDHNNDAERIKNKIQKDFPDIKVTRFEVARDEPGRVSGGEVIDLDASDQLIDAGGEMLFNPFLLTELNENPFLSESRRYPMDMNFPKEVSSTITINLTGLTAKKIPEPVKISIPSKASFTYNAGASGNTIQIRAILKIDQHIFTETEYLELRRFYTEVIKKIGSLIELSKT